MTTETTLAFAHPEERALATAPVDLRDRISLRDHVTEVEIGAFQAERGARQRLRFNVVVEVRAQSAPLADDVDRILSYDKLLEAIAQELAAERLNLLETLAERVAARILLEPQAMRAFIRIEKLDRGPFALGVEIMRTRATQPVRLADDSAVHPLVAYLDNDSIDAPDLSARLDALQGQGDVVLCVGLPREGAPDVTARAVQRRIDLLALEQNAWRLAARDARCVVVGSRTEIDWAIRQGQMIVWAPSKLILDATDSPACSPRDGVALALWLAEHLAARCLLLPDGMAAPAGSHVPTGRLPQA
jgi:7,8-dihydroneopterin aldolase/epimerase/oxygenase